MVFHFYIAERLGTLFAPVKYDMQGNIDVSFTFYCVNIYVKLPSCLIRMVLFQKIRKFYNFDKNSCLLELMITEATKGNSGHESVLWLNRYVLML